MNKVLQVAVTVFCTFAISSAFAQCRPGSPCYQGGGYSYYGDQHQQQPEQYRYNRQQQQQQRQQQSANQAQGQMHPTGEPSHYYQGLPVYMEGDAPPPPGADRVGPQGKNAMTPPKAPAGGPQNPPAGK